MLIESGEFAFDLGNCLRWGKLIFPLFVISNWCISNKNVLGWSAVVFCACEIVQLSSLWLELCTNLTVKRVIKETPNKWRPIIVKKNCVMQWYRLMFLTGCICVFPLSPSRVFSDSTLAVQVNCILLSKGQYVRLLSCLWLARRQTFLRL